METLMRIGLSNAAVSLLLALGVVGAALVCRRPALLHRLWLLVLIKLLTPPLLTVPLTWPGPARATEMPAELEAVVAPAEPHVVDVPGAAVSGIVVQVAAVDAPAPKPVEDHSGEPAATAPATVCFWQLPVAIAWLTGTLGWFGLALARLLRFRRLLRHAHPAPANLSEKVARLASELGLRRAPGAWLIPGRLPPMLWAAGAAPRLLLPADLLQRLPADQLEPLLIHELAHLKRRDHWVRLLEFVVRGLYWWHPVVWYACRELREAEEQCCDAWVVSLRPVAGRTYAIALVETLDFLAEARTAAPLLASGIGRVSDLKRRLSMIMRGMTPRELGWHGGLAVIALGLALLPLLPTWAQEEQAPDKQPPRQKGEPADKLRAELKKLEEAVRQKQQEIQEIQRHMQAAAKQLHEAEGHREGQHGGPGVRVEDVILRFNARPADAPREIVLRQVDGKWVVVEPREHRDRIIILAQPRGDKPNIVPPPRVNPLPPIQFTIPVDPARPQPGGQERRIEQLEKRIQDLERLIRERLQPRPGQPGGVGGLPAPGAPGVPGTPGVPPTPGAAPGRVPSERQP